MADDPVVRRLLRFAVGLRAGGGSSDNDVLATYLTTDEREEFASADAGC